MNSAVDTTTSVTPPALIVQLLDKLALPYRTCDDSPELNPAQRIQAVLVDDAIGALLVLFPRDHLLDLSRVGELTGRQLLAVKPDRLTRMLSKHSLQVLPGLPPLTSSPCLYEERLLQQPALFIDSGHPGLLLEMASHDF
ncbi:MAG TPA: histidine kinase, partial [Pseudomonas sp.]|nr:histidine kinase [Pseudomonas sp.]